MALIKCRYLIDLHYNLLAIKHGQIKIKAQIVTKRIPKFDIEAPQIKKPKKTEKAPSPLRPQNPHLRANPSQRPIKTTLHQTSKTEENIR